MGADSNRSRISIIKESTWGTTPTGSLTIIPFNGSTLKHEKGTVLSENIRSDRVRSSMTMTSLTATGGFSGEMPYSDLSLLLQATLNATTPTDTSAGEITGIRYDNGTTEHSFSIEDAALDIDEFRSFTGCKVNTFGMSITAQQNVTYTVDFMGKGGTIAQSTIGTGYTSASGNDPHVAGLDVATLKVNGSALTIGVRSLNANFACNRGHQPSIQTTESGGIRGGYLDVTGTIELYFEDDAQYDQFLTHADLALIIGLGDADPVATDGDVLTKLTLPRIKLSTADAPVSGGNSDRFVSFGWQALYDASAGYMIRIEETSFTAA